MVVEQVGVGGNVDDVGPQHQFGQIVTEGEGHTAQTPFSVRTHTTSHKGAVVLGDVGHGPAGLQRLEVFVSGDCIDAQQVVHFPANER